MHRRKHFHYRAVGFIEDDGRWGAICLETSFIGYGETFDEALSDLVEATRFAIDTILLRGHRNAVLGGPAGTRYEAMYRRAIERVRPNAAFQIDLDRAA